VNGIPQKLIAESEAIVILPGACQVVPGAYNGQGGRGIAMIQNKDGSWSNPIFVSLSKGSPGFQLAASGSDIILLFKDKNDIIDIDKAKITLENNVRIATGPVNWNTPSNTEVTIEKEIYSFYRSEELYSNICLTGGILSYYDKLTDSFYGIENINAAAILDQVESPHNDQVNDLIAVLNISSK